MHWYTAETIVSGLIDALYAKKTWTDLRHAEGAETYNWLYSCQA
jgi:hypothetical protein